MMSACYRRYNNDTVQIVPGFTPCLGTRSSAGVMPCCVDGRTCLENGICYDRNPAPGESGYYMATCTDPTYKDPICPSRCIDLFKGDIVYDSSTNLWSCCGQINNSDTNSAVSCNQPTSEKFQDLSPEQLQRQASAASSLTSSFTVVSSFTAGPSPLSSPSGTTDNSASSSSSLSTPVAAALGVCLTIITLSTVAAVVFFSRYRSRKRTSPKERAELSGGLPQISELSSGTDPYSTTSSIDNSNANAICHELDHNNMLTEYKELAAP